MHLSGEGNSLQYSCLENPVDGGAWKAAVHGVAEGRTWLSHSTFTFHFHALEKKMATHSSALAWRIPEMAEPGGLPSMGSHRVGHDWSDLAAEHSLALPFFGIGMKTDIFQACGHCWVFQIGWHIDYSTFTASSFRIWYSLTGIPSPPLSLFIVMLPKACLSSYSRMSGSKWVITPLNYFGREDHFCIVLCILATSS